MTIIYILIAVLLIWTIGTYIAVRNIEEPKYRVLSVHDAYEIRQYESYLVAETTVSGTYNEALNEGFRNIANYIFGDNTSADKIAMTAPVLENDAPEQEYEKIAMTAPVLEVGDETERIVSFIMPSKYTLETLPKPNKDNVTIREVPARKVAVLKYTWYTNSNRVDKKSEQLLGALANDRYTTIGETTSARYNPPLSIPFLLRNEILVEIE